jgi:hypothetical protein
MWSGFSSPNPIVLPLDLLTAYLQGAHVKQVSPTTTPVRVDTKALRLVTPVGRERVYAPEARRDTEFSKVVGRRSQRDRPNELWMTKILVVRPVLSTMVENGMPGLRP